MCKILGFFYNFRSFIVAMLIFTSLNLNMDNYPEVCLRAREIQPVTRVDPKPILRAFMQEIKAKFPTICGAPMQLQSKAKFPISQLFESGQVII